MIGQKNGNRTKEIIINLCSYVMDSIDKYHLFEKQYKNVKSAKRKNSRVIN
jgi:hypothetical protein